MWELAEASLHTEIAQDVRDEAIAIADAERSRMRLAAGLRAGACASLVCHGGFACRGHVLDVGADWVLISGEQREVSHVQLSTVMRAQGLQHRLPDEGAHPAVASTWTQALRGLVAQQPGVVRLAMIDGWTVRAALNFAGSDFLRVEHDGGQSDLAMSAISAIAVPAMRLPG